MVLPGNCWTAFRSSIVYVPRGEAPESVRWTWKQFGLDLASPATYLKRSKVMVSVPDTYDDENNPFEGGLCDPKMKGEDSQRYFDSLHLLCGHVPLDAPVVRVECAADVLRILKEQCPSDEIALNPPTGFTRNEEPLTTEQILSILQDAPVQRIKEGEGPLAHNKMAPPAHMMLTVLPVPAFNARPTIILDSGDYSECDLNHKLVDVIRINGRLVENRAAGAPQSILQDLTELLQYHVTTYLDNQTRGIPPARHRSGRELKTVAQRLGVELGKKKRTEEGLEVAGSSVERIVRCINSGERFINTHSNSVEHLASDLAKQAALGAILPKSSTTPTIYLVNELGDAKGFNIHLVTDAGPVIWNGVDSIAEDQVIFAKGRTENEEIVADGGQFKSLESEYGWKVRVKTKRMAAFVYGQIERQQQNQDSPSVIVLDPSTDIEVLSTAISMVEELSLDVVIVAHQESRRRVDKDTRAIFEYKPKPNANRNVRIAISEMKTMNEFSDFEEYLSTLDEGALQELYKIMRHLSREKASRILRSVLLERSSFDLKYLRNYVRQILKASGLDIDHLDVETGKDKEKSKDERGSEYPTAEGNDDSDSGEFEIIDSIKYNQVKGLEPLITWAKMTGQMFTPEALEYGFNRYPTGLLLTGVPGCGKSMVAKAIANEWGLGFLRVNPDELVGKLVSDNEKLMRQLLDGLKSNTPIVCFMDEAEKLLGQTRSADFYRSSDAGRDSAESILLQFMEDDNSGVFFIFTSNDFQRMSPALLDRFDERFFIDFPAKAARGLIIASMIRERKRDSKDFDIKKLATISKGFTGRDIRSSIDEAMRIAFTDGKRPFSTKDLISTFSTASPTSEVHKKEIDKMREQVAGGKMRLANDHASNRGSIDDNDESLIGWN